MFKFSGDAGALFLFGHPLLTLPNSSQPVCRAFHFFYTGTLTVPLLFLFSTKYFPLSSTFFM